MVAYDTNCKMTKIIIITQPLSAFNIEIKET